MAIESPKRKISTWLFNPAVYIAGAEALSVGLGLILVATWIGSLSRTHFDGVIDVHAGVEAPRWFFFAEGLLAWLSVVIVFWIVGKLAARTSFRLVDLAGTQALARGPMFFSVLFALLPGNARFTQSLMTTLQSKTSPSVELFLTPDAVSFFVVLGVMIVAMGWMVALMYNSYAHVCHVQGGRAVGSFIVALILAEALSKIILFGLATHILADDSWKPRKGELPPPETMVNYQHERHYTFDTEEGLEKINVDKGLSVGVESGEFRIHGRTAGPEWKPDSVQVPVADDGGVVDISGRFRIAEREGNGLVFIEANTDKAGPIIYMYQWGPFAQSLLSAYQIQRRWLHLPSTLVSDRATLRAVGNEEEAFNTMRIHIREDHLHADLFVNDTYQDTIVFTQQMGKVITAKMEFQTDCMGKRYDIRFDDLRVRWNDSPEELRCKDAEIATGGLLLRYAFDDATNNAAIITDSSGQEAHGAAYGAPQFAAGVQGNAIVLDGEDDYVMAPLTRRLRDVQNSNYTMMAWFCPAAVPSFDKYCYGVVIKPGCDYGIAYDAGRTFRFTHFFNVIEDEKKSASASENIAGIWLGQGSSQPCQWHHIAVVGHLDENRFAIFTNGVLAATEVQRKFGRSLENWRPWYIGVADPNVWRCPARGKLDDVRIYNRALTGGEIQAIFEETHGKGQ